MATELGSVAPVRRKEFRPRHNDAKFDASEKCGSDKCESDECETVQNVQKTDSDDAPETSGVESMAVDVTESRPIQTEHTTRSFKKRKAPSPVSQANHRLHHLGGPKSQSLHRLHHLKRCCPRTKRRRRRRTRARQNVLTLTLCVDERWIDVE